MSDTVPIAVIIPTYNRGESVLSVLEEVARCDPQPAEILIHIDCSDGALEEAIKERFPNVGILQSATRLGPGGGRHRCLQACTQPYAVSFDDDSHPVDRDFFDGIPALFAEYPKTAILATSIVHRGEPERPRTSGLIAVANYVGCGYAIRLSAYRSVRGYLDVPVAYGLEESDLSLQLYAAGWDILEVGSLRVYHNTDLVHHESPDITAGTLTNVGLFAFLHYPVIGWMWGAVQVANKVFYGIRRGRIRGTLLGIRRIPAACFRYRRFRNPVSLKTLGRFLRFRKTGFNPR